jgi:hypothetical protein
MKYSSKFQIYGEKRLALAPWAKAISKIGRSLLPKPKEICNRGKED